MGDKIVKILFQFYSDVLDEWTVETMWAEIVDAQKGYYKLDNIPFYASAACGDIVYAEYEEDENRLLYKKTIRPSGNSTIQVVIMDKEIDTNEIREKVSDYGCETEKYSEGYFVIDVPANKDYNALKTKLNELQENGIIDYAEPYLSKNHWY